MSSIRFQALQSVASAEETKIHGYGEKKITAIFEACSFQDLTSQRIRRAIEHLQSVETMLDRIIPGETGHPAINPPATAMAAEPAGDGTIDQSVVDRLIDF